MEWTSKTSAMIQVNWKSVITKDSKKLRFKWLWNSKFKRNSWWDSLECFIMMTVHVPYQKVINWHIHQVQKSSTSVIWRNVSDLRICGKHKRNSSRKPLSLSSSYHSAIVCICFPLSLPSFVIRTSPWMSPHLLQDNEKWPKEKNKKRLLIVIINFGVQAFVV